MSKILSLAALLLLLSACSSNVTMNNVTNAYQYQGEKYGVLNVELSEGVKEDLRKIERADQIDLAAKIKEKLVADELYDEASPNVIDVTVTKLHIRNAFNAIMFGFMSGSDSLTGVVKLKDGGGNTKANFDISASYSLGGVGGGNNGARLGWLGRKFAELTTQTIKGKPEAK